VNTLQSYAALTIAITFVAGISRRSIWAMGVVMAHSVVLLFMIIILPTSKLHLSHPVLDPTSESKPNDADVSPHFSS
jgi:cell division protein FtsW (lipid II flippase)